MTNETQTRQAGDPELRALVATSKTAAAIVEEMRGESAAEIAEARNVSTLLKRAGVQWLKDASDETALAFARICVHVGLNPLLGEAYLIHGGLHVGIVGRRKLASRTGQWAGEDAPRLLTPEEETIHGVRPGDIARVVQVWNTTHRGPAVGVGIVRRGEVENAQKAGKGRDGKYFLPLAELPEFMAAKRAANNAYKVGFPSIDLPVAETIDRGGREQIIDVESGRPLLEEGDGAATGEVPRADALTGEIIERERENRAPRPVTADASDWRDAGLDGSPVRDAVTDAEPAAEPFVDTDAPALAALMLVLGGTSGLEVTPNDVCQALGVREFADAAAVVGLDDVERLDLVETVGVLMAGGTPLANAASQVHAARAQAGQRFSADAILAEDIAATRPPEDAAPAPRGRRGN